jgi:hypothetical protein
MRNSVYASFDDPSAARNAMGALLDHGARAEDISLVMPDKYVDRDDDDDTETATDNERSAETGITTTTGDDAASGAAKGAGIGLGVGAVAAIVSVLVPGIGLVIGGGALATALAGAAATTAAGAIAGGVTGYLKDQGVPDEYATKFSETYARGGAILTISVPSGDVDSATAEGVLAKYGHANVNVWRHDASVTHQPI